MRCLGFGMGLGTIGAVGNSGSSALPTPWSQASCVAWWDAAATQTIGSLYHSAGTGPAVTITGSQSVWSPVGIRVEVTTGGSSGGLFRVSYDSGATFAHSAVAIPYGSTYALDGAATGFSIGFPSGTYVTTDVYEGQGTSAPSLKTGTDIIAASGTAAPRLYVGASGILGRAAWSSDTTHTSFADAGFASWPTLATKFYLYGVASFRTANGGNGQMFSSGATQTPTIYTSSATVVNGFNGGAAPLAAAINTPKRFILQCTATNADGIQGFNWGALGGAAGIQVNATSNGFYLFSRSAGTAQWDGLVSCIGLFSGVAASSPTLTALDAWLTASSGGAGFTGGSALTS